MKAAYLDKLAEMVAKDSREHGYVDYIYPVERTMVKAACEVAEILEAFMDERYAGAEKYRRLLNEIMISGVSDIGRKVYGLYHQMVKNSVQDEMADVAIYTLLAAANGGYKLADALRAPVFTYAMDIRVTNDHVTVAGKLMSMCLEKMKDEDMPYKLMSIIDYLDGWMREAFHEDLLFYIKQKIEYNKKRPFMHGRINNNAL